MSFSRRFRPAPVVGRVLLALVLGGYAVFAARESLGRTQPDGWNAAIGGGLGLAPRYLGASGFKAQPAPFAELTYGRYFLSTTRGLGAQLYGDSSYGFGVALGFDRGRDQDDDGRLRGLGDIKSGADIRLYGSYRIDALRIDASLHRRVGQVSGVLVDLGASWRWQASPSFTATFGPSLTWADGKLTRGFFGVTDAQALRARRLANPLDAYRPESGLRDVSFNATATWKLSDHWSLVWQTRLTQLVGDAADSPLTQRAFQPSLTGFAVYRF
jgi:outer membrane scaffolding protein for murein synthesis (MipA/OmpV family)